jgi:hypothetical protein
MKSYNEWEQEKFSEMGVPEGGWEAPSGGSLIQQVRGAYQKLTPKAREGLYALGILTANAVTENPSVVQRLINMVGTSARGTPFEGALQGLAQELRTLGREAEKKPVWGAKERWASAQQQVPPSPEQ